MILTKHDSVKLGVSPVRESAVARPLLQRMMPVLTFLHLAASLVFLWCVLHEQRPAIALSALPELPLLQPVAGDTDLHIAADRSCVAAKLPDAGYDTWMVKCAPTADLERAQRAHSADAGYRR